MTLKYDFDMFYVVPRHLQEQMRAMGVDEAKVSERVALFRDERTVAALWQADSEVQDLFLASGFGLNVYSSGAPEGCYPAEDKAARLEAVAQLSETLTESRQVLTRNNWGEFSITDFLDHLGAAKPVDMAGIRPDERNAPMSMELASASLPMVYTPDDKGRNLPMLMTKVAFWTLFGITIGQYSGMLF
ncbi:hypothetical protein GLS40_00575 [Pseudooceanicola sp. 216_PA32_1]|uniref:Uncharacterized protein n=1 Tax=Pseudooceanicola pacificus TaxID=2676438 RepID=A0A844WB93_9RHOB|nr:hypothetical protein [Pseudooceanicola pacificus]MWB76510.1 hypothetical protein [Pseudooceanicola pacificus]